MEKKENKHDANKYNFMRNLLKSIFFVLVGLILGGIVNSAIITYGPSIIPPPEGVDVTTAEGLKAGMHLMQPKHFISPFLAHALGTLFGAMFVAWVYKRNKMTNALIIGILFLFGGISMVLMVPSPLWFTITDLTLAYIPMAYFGGILGIQKGQLKIFRKRF